MKKINILLFITFLTLNVSAQNFIQKELDSRYINDLESIKFNDSFNIRKDTIQMNRRNLTFFQMSNGSRTSYLPFYVPKGKYFAVVTFMRNKSPIFEPLSDSIKKPYPVIYDTSGKSTSKKLLKINEAKEHHLSIEFNSSYNHFQNGENLSYEIYYSNLNTEYSGKYYFSYGFFDDNDYQKSKSYYHELFIGFYLFDTKDELVNFTDSMKNE